MPTLALPPPEAVPIGMSCFSFASLDGRVVYFSNLEPFDSHDEDDRPARLLRIARLAMHGIRHKDLQAAFGVSRTTVHRALNRLEAGGEASFHTPRRGRGTSVIVGAKAREANRLLAAGMSGAAVARALGVATATVNHNRRKGFIGNGRPAGAASPGRLDRSARDRRDRAAPMGRGARDSTGRIAASTGAMIEVPPRFDEPLSAVTGGGVLAALPMLLREGLLARASAFLSLPKGDYGLTSVLLLLAFLFLARIRNPEALRHEAPGEWGAVLGLDRCPEVKTLRRKIRALAADVQQVRNWQDALAQAWLQDQPDLTATLSVDGHVKVYTGRKGRLPKHFVSRQKLCLAASTSDWVNVLGGQPLLCLHKDLDPRMTQALEHDILPALERLGLPGPEAPDLTAVRDARPALTLVFDREGWSPALFTRLARRGIAVLTWHKGFKGKDWPTPEFRTVEVPLHGPGATRARTARLAERRIRLPDEQDRRPVRIRWRFGSIFAQIARTSDFYTLLDNKIIWGLRSRYAIALYQHISALSGQRNRSVTYTIDELRAVLGVLPHRLLAYKDLNTRALKPAIEQINACTAARWRLTVELHKRRRSVQSVTIAWEPKEEETQPELAFDAPAAPDSDATATSASGPPPARAPAFPGAGSIKDTAWGAIAVELVQGYDADTVAEDYRAWCRSSGIPLDKRGGERRFRTFCAGYADNQSKPREKPAKQADYGYDGPSQEEVDRIEAIKREVDATFAGQA